MAANSETRQVANAEDSSSLNGQQPNLKEYTRVHLASSNDCEWLHEVVSSDAISAGRISPQYLVRVYYKETEAASNTKTKDFGTGSFALVDLNYHLASKHIRAVILCHRNSSQVDPDILNLLWARFKLEVSFMRQHLDYKEFRDEPGCPQVIRNRLREEDSMHENFWTFGGRWNPIRLPSETHASILRLSVDSECLSVCCRDGVVVAFIRSQSVYQEPLSQWMRANGLERRLFDCTVDLLAATVDPSAIIHETPSDVSEFTCSIVHFYARLLVLRCYEDYNLRHDTQPIDFYRSERVGHEGDIDIMDMHHRRLELVKLKQNLCGYLGPLAPEHNSGVVHKGSDSAGNLFWRKLQDLVTDVEMLLSLYDNTMRIYEWHINNIESMDKSELAVEQLAEAKESKDTAISLGRLSKLAFLYLPINSVCTILGMNLSIFGQGEVPVWVFLMLVVFFGLLTYLPVYLPTIDEQTSQRNRLVYHLARRSVPAGFWFPAFTLNHNYRQNFEIMNAGLAQVLLGSFASKTKGMTDERHDRFFEKATWGSEAFWKDKVKRILLGVEELNVNHQQTELAV